MKKLSSHLIGLLQALGVVIYCILIIGLFQLFAKIMPQPPKFFGPVLSLIVLVFSAAVTGSLIFGRAAYLALNRRIKEGLSVLGFTLLYCFGIIIIITILIIAFV